MELLASKQLGKAKPLRRAFKKVQCLAPSHYVSITGEPDVAVRSHSHR